jgi:tetratricopeptide (TPR) repeat protein
MTTAIDRPGLHMNPGRNDPCPCGSGKRYKNCCGLLAAPGSGALPATSARPSLQEIGALVELVNQDRLAEAEHASGALLAAHPETGILWKILSVALARQGKDAMRALRRAAELMPEDAEAQGNLGDALFELSRSEAAAAAFRRVVELQPRSAPGHFRLALALRQQGRLADAEAACRAALAIEPGYVEALCFLAELRADGGRFAEAEELFRRALALNPEFAPAYAGTAVHRHMTGEDQGWLAGAEALLARPLPLAHEITLRYAVGKYHDDLQQFDRAFAQYRQANELSKRNRPRYDGAKLARLVDKIIRDFDPGSMPAAVAGASDSELPVFIIGMPRSGTSLAEQILASHPAVSGAGEVRHWNDSYGALQRAAAAQRIDVRVIEGLARDYLDRVAALANGAQRVVDKMPANFLYAGLIHAVFPRARIIHMRRHPIDTCLSIYFQNFFGMGPYANDLDDLAHYYGQYLRLADRWRAALPAAALLEVPYEALVENQEGWSRRMVEFIGLPWDRQCLDYYKTDRTVITASKWQVRQRLNPASVGRWRNYQDYIGPLRGLLDSPRRT